MVEPIGGYDDDSDQECEDWDDWDDGGGDDFIIQSPALIHQASSDPTKVFNTGKMPYTIVEVEKIRDI
jgi:hypothetical protein